MEIICMDCGQAPLKAQTENIRYLEGGLPNVVLKDILVETCPACGMRFVTIPRMAELHRVMAKNVILKPGRLVNYEITFLRKTLGLDKKTFAAKMHVRIEQVSKWETRNAPATISPSHDLALRLLVAQGQRFEDYFGEVDTVDLRPAEHPTPVTLAVRDNHWIRDLAA